jgi:hypothetical protein
MSKRRRSDDIVRLNPLVPGLGGKMVLIDPQPPDDCRKCQDPECNEWPILFEVDGNGLKLGGIAKNLSECEMEDA